MKKKTINVVLSFLLPGTGHLYLGLYKLGGIILLTSIALYLLITQVTEIFSLAYLLLWIGVIIHGYKSTKKINKNLSLG